MVFILWERKYVFNLGIVLMFSILRYRWGIALILILNVSRDHMYIKISDGPNMESLVLLLQHHPRKNIAQEEYYPVLSFKNSVKILRKSYRFHFSLTKRQDLRLNLKFIGLKPKERNKSNISLSNVDTINLSQRSIMEPFPLLYWWLPSKTSAKLKML